MKKIKEFFRNVKKEMKKVRFPEKKEMTKYSVAAISFILFFALFFSLSDFIITGLKMLVK